MHSDPIADMATRMRNALRADHESTKMPYSKVKELILEVLVSKTFVSSYSVVKEGKFEELKVVFNKKKKDLSFDRVSKPGQRIYKKSQEIRQVQNGFGISIISTSQGVMAGFEAHRKGLGGEIMLEVY